MSHESAIAGLKALMKQPIVAVDPHDHVKHLNDESDRSTIILHAALVEEMLLGRLEKFMPSLNSEEKKEIFDFEGPIGTFSNRIRLSHGLGIIDRPTKRKIDLLRIMRNVAAHCHSRITFKTPEISTGICSLFGQPDRALASWETAEIRNLYSVACNSLAYVLTHEEMQMSWSDLWSSANEIRSQQQKSSRGK